MYDYWMPSFLARQPRISSAALDVVGKATWGEVSGDHLAFVCYEVSYISISHFDGWVSIAIVL
jgi:hypothetical protein